MDADLPDEDVSSLSHLSELEEEANLPKWSRKRPLPRDEEHILVDDDERSSPGYERPLKPSVETRWDRLKRLYNEDYVKLFRETFADDRDDPRFKTTQHGAVFWSPDEKLTFFEALARYGRYDLHRIAATIGTKSEVEVKAYIDLIQRAELERQLYEKQTKNISKAEIPAAVDMDVDYDQGLEDFADAVAAYQDRYDQAVGQQRSQSSMPWLVDADTAARLDEQTNEIHDRSADSEDLSSGETEDQMLSHQLFKLSTFLELSEKVFMNGSKTRPYEHWIYCAEKGERPSLTSEVVEMLHDLALHYLRKMMQTSIFLAQSRIRSTTDKYYIPTSEVKVEDVQCMRQILNTKDDLWDYWTKLPRRAQFRVVPGDHRKGYDDQDSLSIAEVEAALAIRHHGRRLRSLSVASSSSRSSLSASEESDESNTPTERISRDGFAEYNEPTPLHISLQAPIDQSVDRGGRRKNEPEFEIEVEDAGHSGDDDNDTEDDRDTNKDDDSLQAFVSDDEASSPGARLSRAQMQPRKRRRIAEEGIEIYLQDLDVYNRVQEEHRLSKLLGIGTPSGSPNKYMDIGNRPQVPRKSVEDVYIWQPHYQAAWETYDLNYYDDVDGELPQHDVPQKSVEK